MNVIAKKSLAILLLLTILFSLSACTPGDAQNPAQTQVFRDDAGREVILPEKIQRIVPAGALGQIILYAIAPELFVGLASELGEEARGILDEEYFSLPCFGSLYADADLNVEELALAAPDVIIDIGDSKEAASQDMEKLQSQTNIPAIYLYASLETMPQTYRTLGKLLGKEERGEELAQFCERVYQRSCDIMARVGENRVNALYILGEEGLNVIAKDSYHAELIDLLTNNLAVVDNPLSKGSGNEVSMEQIALWNPDFIIFGPNSIYDTVARQDAWQELEAIKNGAYVEVPQLPHNWMSMPPSVQRYLGLIWLTAELYPDYCDYDVTAEIMEYYRLFYHCELTQAQYASITANAFLR